MQRLDGRPELLDGPLETTTLEANLRDLTRVNRWLGGTALSWAALDHVRRSLSATRMTLVDVGTGGADIPLALCQRAERAGYELRVEALDVRPEIVAAARRRVGGLTAVNVRLATPMAIDMPDGSCDVAHASLVLHHLDANAAGQLLAEMRRVARRAVIVNDLMRARRWWLGAWLLSRLLTRNRYTRHDAPLSVRRAWQPAELAAMAGNVGLEPEAQFDDLLGHRYAMVLRPTAN